MRVVTGVRLQDFRSQTHSRSWRWQLKGENDTEALIIGVTTEKPRCERPPQMHSVSAVTFDLGHPVPISQARTHAQD